MLALFITLLVFLYILFILNETNKIKRLYFLISILFCLAINGYSQDGFILPDGVDKDKISFKLVNNLVVIPVEVNGTKLTFLLDTGVSSTIMFSLSEVDSLQLNNTESIRLRGLGKGGSIPALKSKKNKLKIGKAIDVDHTLYVIFDESLNLSTRMGIPIHGIVGYDFFKNFIVKTNYISEKLIIYSPETYKPKSCKKCETFDIILQGNKPYLNIDITIDQTKEEVILLIDSGSSDAIWLFDDKGAFNDGNKKYFDDFLGEGISGEIFGKRSKLSNIGIGSFELENVKVAFPDKESIENIKLYEERDGSIGGDLLNRFKVIYDYPNKKITLKKNGHFKSPFHYNMSGLTLKHDGVILVKSKNTPFNSSQTNRDGVTAIPMSTVYNFYLAPRFIVSEIRKGSPADLVGIIKGDEVVSVNGNETHNFKLHDLIGLFASKSGKKITFRIKRNNITFKKTFYLKEML